MASQAASTIKALAASGVSEVAFTEVDIVGAPANDYVAVTQACLSEPKCVGLTVWGVRDPVRTLLFLFLSFFLLFSCLGDRETTKKEGLNADFRRRTRGERARAPFSSTPTSALRPRIRPLPTP